MDDLISRKWLVECVNEGWIKFDTEKDENIFTHLVRDIAPSVQQKEVTGKWFLDKNRQIICSNCEQPIFRYHKLDFEYRPTFCPNCGAKMRKEDTE